MVELKEHREEDFMPPTYFAEPDRARADLLEYQINLVCSHPMTEALLNAFNSMVLVLNAHRQAVAVNDAFLRSLGIDDPGEAVGLRPGEAVSCVHAETAPNGCGTGKACASCGAVLSIIASRKLGCSVERECIIVRKKKGKEEPLEFWVCAAPLAVEGNDFTVVTIADISEKKRAQAVERMFIHDLLNYVAGLKGISELLMMDGEACAGGGAFELSQIRDVADCIVDMITGHRDLTLIESGDFTPLFKEVSIGTVVDKVKKIIKFNSISKQKSLVTKISDADFRFRTDAVLLSRVLVNMLKNAMEAAAPGGMVILRCERGDRKILFSVWNAGEIPAQTALRIFQRYFSTKTGNGRGLGTYSMKLIAERCLGGTVSFKTSPEGTTFLLSLPV
jgi:K+-sensing histidine kinase KdpD